MELPLPITLVVVCVLALTVTGVALALWARTAYARRRAHFSTLADSAATIRERNNALAATDRNLRTITTYHQQQ